MFFEAPQTDEKNNFISLTLFESYLAKFILEHPALYQTAFLKLLDQINTASTSKARVRFSVFSQLQTEYPEYGSFEGFHEAFNLPAADYLLKLTADYLFPAVSAGNASQAEAGSSRRSPTNPFRNPLLFDSGNRGVDEAEADEGITTHALGIVSEAYQPQVLRHYFEQAIEPAGQYYTPKENSYVAYLLRQYQVPLISGASGSTQALIARLLPHATDLTREESALIVFVQACNMVAHGHHSLFEAMIVADDLELIPVNPQKNQAEFYLQCIPESIQNHPDFVRFINSDYIKSLLSSVPVIENIDTSTLADSGTMLQAPSKTP